MCRKPKIGITLLPILLLATHVFSQNTLDFFLKAAKENNPTIKENLAASEKAVIQESIINAEYQKPKVFVTGDIYYPPLFPGKDDPRAVGYDVAITDGGLYSGLINVQQPLFNKPVYKTLEFQTKIESENGLQRADFSWHQLEKEVTDQYIVTYQNLKQTEFTETLRDHLIQQKAIITALAEKGIYKRSDMLIIDIEIQNEATELNNLKSAYYRHLHALHDLCGLAADTEMKLEPPVIILKEISAPSRFLERFRLDSMLEVNNQHVNELKYKPKINLYGNAGLNAIEFPGIQRKFGTGIGINMMIPLYDGNQRDFTRQQSAINLQVINDYRDNFMVRKTNRQKSITTDLEMTDKKISMIRDKLQDYEKLISLYTSELQSGNLRIIDYMNTIKSYLVVLNDLTVCEMNKMLMINEKNYYNW